MIRKIIHIDMDAFFASVEQRDNPQYRGKPIAVGHSGKRGVVMTASYEARKFGVRSAMSSKYALKLCPNLIFVSSNFDAYKEASKKMKEIFLRYTDLIEPISIDEAFLDVTENKLNIPSATIIAKKIKQNIKDELNLTATAGVSINKFLAKVASGLNKPDGLNVIKPGETEKFIDQLPINKIPGIGKVTSRKFENIGVKLCKELKKLELQFLLNKFGKQGKYFYNVVRCIDNNPVKTNRIRKSIGAELTFSEDIDEIGAMLLKLEKIAGIVENRMNKINTYGKTLTLKVKYFDFKQITRSKTLKEEVKTKDELFEISKKLFSSDDVEKRPVRLLGIYLSNLTCKKEKTKILQMDFDF
ncbi:MAG: DNA polymerase IV [Bacteroidetes bacterium]|nr:DNA polymerase IV [Bacteroidota bacterium]